MCVRVPFFLRSVEILCATATLSATELGFGVLCEVGAERLDVRFFCKLEKTD